MRTVVRASVLIDVTDIIPHPKRPRKFASPEEEAAFIAALNEREGEARGAAIGAVLAAGIKGLVTGQGGPVAEDVIYVSGAADGIF